MRLKEVERSRKDPSRLRRSQRQGQKVRSGLTQSRGQRSQSPKRLAPIRSSDGVEKPVFRPREIDLCKMSGGALVESSSS